MKMFTVRLTKKAILQVAVEEESIKSMIDILDSSPAVAAYHLDTAVESEKYAPGLAQDSTAQTAQSVHQSIIEAITRLNEEYDYCNVASWVGSPGDYSPPNDCVCNKCITQGRNYRYTSYNVSVSREMFQYFEKLLLKQGAKRHKWGVSYIEHAKCEISLHDHDQHMTIKSNKPEIKIGPYVWCHKTKDWRAAK